MTARHPVALIVFSNDLDNYLHNIEQERRYIEEALEHYDDTNRLEVITRSSVGIDDIFRLFNRYKGRIAIFHFAGHAGGEGLQLNNQFTDNETGHADGLAQLLGREAQEGQLQLVFLNGCSTAPQVEELKRQGVPSIIGTNYPISDNKAIRFARHLYRSLSNADMTDPFEQAPPTLGEAYKNASAYVQTNFNIDEIKDHRGFTFEVETEKEEPVIWELFTKNEGWTLPNAETHEDKAFDKILTRRLIEALQTKRKAIKKFVQNIPSDERNHWETVKLYRNKAQQKIEQQFPWVIGWELRRLFWIGRRPNSPEKVKQYLEHCLQTYRLTLQLVNYTLIARLWEIKLKEQMDFEGIQSIKNYFTPTLGVRLETHLSVFKNLIAIYVDNDLECPFPTLIDSVWSDKNHSIYEVCEKLHQILEHKAQPSLKHCFGAEKQLADILVQFRFLAGFQLMSIKKIEYQRFRDKPAHYIKDFNILGRKSKRQQDDDTSQHGRLIRYSKDPSDTYAIFLWKGRTNVNLFPFILDFNALANEEHPKIYFFDHRIDDNTLKYFFSEGESYKELTYLGIMEQKEHDRQQDIVADDEQLSLKIDIAIQQFLAAYNTLFDTEEALDSEEEEDFEDIPNF